MEKKLNTEKDEQPLNNIKNYILVNSQTKQIENHFRYTNDITSSTYNIA